MVIVVAIMPSENLYGQLVRSHERQVWFRGGYDAPTGIILGLAAQYSFFTVEGRLTGKEVIPDDVGGSDMGLLVGLATPAFKYPYLHMSVAAGFTVTLFSGDCEYEGCPDGLAGGLALSFHLSFRPLRFLGIGFFMYSNRNSQKSFGGSGLMLELGKLR